MSVHHVHSVEELTNLKASKDKLVVVDFSATWCGPCRAIAPFYEELAKKTPNAVFIHVDIDELADAPDVSDVSGVPTFKFYKNNTLITQFSGANQAKLQSTVQAHV